MKTNLILEAVKTALLEGNAKVNLNEASALTGSGSGVGGRVIYDDAFAALRLANPLRRGSRIINTIGSDEAFVVKTGNATLIQSGSDNPWGYPVNTNTGSPDISTSFWQLPVRSLNATVPVRTAVLSDVNNLEETLVEDLMLEFSQQEALSMMFNNDQSGSTTVNYGATSGVRGLNSYTGSTSAAAFGTNGSAITNGIHTLATVSFAGTTPTYDKVCNIANALPNTGTGLLVNGFRFGFTAKNGNGWDNGMQDYLAAYVNVYDSKNAKALSIRSCSTCPISGLIAATREVRLAKISMICSGFDWLNKA